MRSWAAIGALLLSVGAQAQGALDSAKKDLNLPSPSTTNSPGVGAMQLLQLVVAMAAVLFLMKWLLPKLVAKFSKKLNPSLSSSIRIEESASFAGGMLYVVTARNKQLLVCASQQGVSCLADLTDPIDTPPEPPAFFELLDQAGTKPSADLFMAAVSVPEEDPPAPQMDPKEVKAALERLERLAG